MASLSDIFNEKWQQLKERIPQRDICLAPADAFFCELVEIPADTAPGEIPGFAELSLESLSPFPLEHMAWGFLYPDNHSHILVYATPKTRLSKLGLNDLESWHQVFPGFLSIYGMRWDTDRVVFVSQTGSVSALFIEAGQQLPSRVVSRPVNAELLSDEAILQTREKLCDKLGNTDGYETDPGVYIGNGCHVHSDGHCTLQLRYVKPEGEFPLTHNLPLSERQTWQADLRDPDFARREARSRILGRRLWTGLVAAGATTALLLVGQLGYVALESWNQMRERQIERMEPAVNRVEHTQTLADRLNRSVEQDIRAFVLLREINANRPDSVFFSRVGARNFNRLVVEGESTEGVTPVNDYADLLNAKSGIQDVINNSQTRGGRTSFELEVTFSAEGVREAIDSATDADDEPTEPAESDDVAQLPQP